MSQLNLPHRTKKLKSGKKEKTKKEKNGHANLQKRKVLTLE